MAQFVAKEPVDIGWFQNWLSMIRAATAGGRRFSRVRVVSVPLTDYSRFGVFCSEYTNAAGEEIRYLTRDQARDLPDYDYWLFDSRLLIKMHFDEEEHFLGGEVIKDPAVIVQRGYWRDAAWHREVERKTMPPVTTGVPQRSRGAPCAGPAAPRVSPAGRADRRQVADSCPRLPRRSPSWRTAADADRRRYPPAGRASLMPGLRPKRCSPRCTPWKSSTPMATPAQDRAAPPSGRDRRPGRENAAIPRVRAHVRCRGATADSGIRRTRFAQSITVFKVPDELMRRCGRVCGVRRCCTGRTSASISC